MPSRLREWRTVHGLTLDELGALTGYSEASISRIERGERDVRPIEKVRLARSLRVPLRDLFDFEEPAVDQAEEPFNL